ncbi:MAG TPA: hypothetical protein VL463_11895 [Kofleriaceae bacterium]|nr:hypothetical protein [Kofleriaceae bacterium]
MAHQVKKHATTTPDTTTTTGGGADVGKNTLTGSLPAASGAYGAFNDIATNVVDLDLAVTAWNSGLDTLNPSVLETAGELALAKWRASLAKAPATLNSGYQAGAQELLQRARATIGKLGLYHCNREHIRFEPEPATDPFTYVPHAIKQASAAIADVSEVIRLARDPALDQGGRMRIATLFQKHVTDDVTSRWMQATIESQKLSRQVFGMDGLAGQIIGELTEKQESEAYFRSVHQDVGAAAVVDLDRDADEMQALAGGGDAGASDYIKILEKHAPLERANLLRLLLHRGALDDCVHRGGGDDLIAAIHATPTFGVWEYSYSKVTMRSKWDRAQSSVKEMGQELPGATLSFVAGVYDGLGTIPGVGGVFKRSAKSIREGRDQLDDAIGVNKEHKQVNDMVGSGAGRIDSAILMSGAGGEFEAAGAVKDAYDTGSLVARIGGEVMELRAAFLEAKEEWPVVTGVITDVMSEAEGLALDAASGDAKLGDHAIHLLSAMLDRGIDKLGKMAGGKLANAEQKKHAKRHAQWDEHRERAGAAASQRASSQELRDETAATLAAGERVRRGGTQAEIDAAKADLEQHAARVRSLASKETLTQLDARAGAEKKLDKAEQAEQKRADDQEIEDDGHLAHYKAALGEKVKEAIVAFGVGALKGAKDALISEARGSGVDLRQVLIAALTKGSTDAVTESVMPVVKEMLVKVVSAMVDELGELISDDLKNVSKLVEGPIEELVDWGVEKLELEEHVERFMESVIERAFGGNEQLAAGSEGDD